MIERCNPPACVRPIGHDGACRPTWHARRVCGVWLPRARAACARTAGHAGGLGGGHRSSWAMASRAEFERRERVA
jgi:hypothetical protein